ncbi:MAG: lipoyl(octanoyl) transferase LipB [Burkholderiales bacterium]|nr:lipoyl(octanoyl) transferase LipB [Burkholderiales bacterium]
MTERTRPAPITHYPSPITRHLGLVDYVPTYEAMREFTAARGPETPDELWLLEHPPVYTMGQAGREAHLPRSGAAIPVVRIDRGGQITYHGPGQAVVYVLADLRRRGLTVSGLVRRIEQAVIDALAAHGIDGARRPGAPGVYVGPAKIAALGLRVRGGCSYHGVALNVDMDLAPFADIDPCGYPGLAVTQLADLGVRLTAAQAGEALAEALDARLAIRDSRFTP